MATMSDFLEAKFLDFFFNGVGYLKPTIWMGWGNGAPSETGTPTNEVVPNIARLSTITFPDGSGGAAATIANDSADFDFDTTGTGLSAANIDHALFFDAQTGGNLLAWIDLTAGGNASGALTVTDPEPIRVATGSMIIDFPDGATTQVNYSDYVREGWLSHIFGVSSLTEPSALACKLHTAAPSATGLLNEFTGGGYAQQVITFGATTPGPSGAFLMVRNAAQLTWTNLLQSPIDFWTIHESAPGANFLCQNDQADSILQSGDNATVAADTLIVAVD